jgi:hypothetical protein
MGNTLILENINEGDLKNYKSCLQLLNSFSSKHAEEFQKLPYHINILDLVKVDENAHSRIFAEILKHSDLENFGILERFCNLLSSKKENFNFKIEKPQITSEKERVDLLILDKEYALIIENKVHNAVDQESQIARYINKVRNNGFVDEKIFIIYLTRDENKKISDQSWMLDNESLKDKFANQFIDLTFRFDILPWLKNEVRPNLKIKDTYLKSSIEQYIDHLEGIFSLRKNQHHMNNELQILIKKELEIKESSNNNINDLNENGKILSKSLEYISNLTDRIKDLQLLNKRDYFDIWEKEKIIYENQDKIIVNDKNFRKIGIKFKFNEEEFCVLLEINSEVGKIQFGLSSLDNSEKSNKIIDFTNDLIKDLKVKELKYNYFIDNNHKSWYGWFYSEDETEGFKDFEGLFNKVKKYLEDHSHL